MTKLYQEKKSNSFTKVNFRELVNYLFIILSIPGGS